MNLHEILLQSATAALALQDPDEGFMPPGHNGSYHDPETPVRNTAHWLITFLKAYTLSGESKFLDAAESTITYLCSDSARPMGASFWHRQNPDKDTCNGLMGQAWTIEALVLAAQQLQRPELVAIAEAVFLLHPYDETTGLWRCVSADGTYLNYDYTFNHQLWFAAAGGLLAAASPQSPDIDRRVRQFLNRLPINCTIHRSGLIRHAIPLTLFPVRIRAGVAASQLWNIKRLPKVRADQKQLHHKEIGYHSFNLYAFALLKQQYPQNFFWQQPKFQRILRYLQSPVYKASIQNNKFGYPYNPPGFEVPFALSVFGNPTPIEQSQWVSQQLEACYDFQSCLMTRNTSDTMTHAARIYEATRLSNLLSDVEMLVKPTQQLV